MPRKQKKSRNLTNPVQVTDPQRQLILYNVLLFYGRQKTNSLRTHEQQQPLIPLLINNISVHPDPGTQDDSPGGNLSGLPIEAKIRNLSIRLLYEVCRAKKVSYPDLGKPVLEFFPPHLR